MAHRKTERNPLFAGRWFEDDIILVSFVSVTQQFNTTTRTAVTACWWRTHVASVFL